MSTEDKIEGAFLRLLARLGDLEDDPDLVELYDEALFGLKARAKPAARKKTDLENFDDWFVKTTADYLCDSYPVFIDPELEFPIRNHSGALVISNRDLMLDMHLRFEDGRLPVPSGAGLPTMVEIADRLTNLGIRLRIIERMYRNKKRDDNRTRWT